MMSVAHERIMYVTASSSLAVLIRQVAPGPRMSRPSMIRPPPLSSESLANETLAPFFTNTLLQTLASVVHAPVKSAASAGTPSDAQHSKTNNESAERRLVVIDVLHAELRLRTVSRCENAVQAKPNWPRALADSA